MEKKTTKYKWLAAPNVRELVKQMEEEKIEQKDIVSLVFNSQYILVYVG